MGLEMNQFRTKKIARRVTIGVLVLMVTLLFVFFAVISLKRSFMYKIADGYKGWAVVRYDDSSCAPLKPEGIFLVITIPSSGVGCTSNPVHEGWQISLYEYVSGGKVTRRIRQSNWGGGREIWAGFSMPYKHSESFFVGTEQELKKSWPRRPQ